MYSKSGQLLYEKNCSLVVTKKMQFKATKNYHLKSITFDIKKTIHKFDEDMQKTITDVELSEI